MSKEGVHSAVMPLNYFCVFDYSSCVLDLIIPQVFTFGLSRIKPRLIETLLYLSFSKTAHLELERNKYWEKGQGDEGLLTL